MYWYSTSFLVDWFDAFYKLSSHYVVHWFTSSKNYLLKVLFDPVFFCSSDASSFSCITLTVCVLLCLVLVWCQFNQRIFGRMFPPMIFAFSLSTMMNGADWMFHPQDSNAMIRPPFGTKFFHYNRKGFGAASSGGIFLNVAKRLFWRNLSAVLH